MALNVITGCHDDMMADTGDVAPMPDDPEPSGPRSGDASSGDASSDVTRTAAVRRHSVGGLRWTAAIVLLLIAGLLVPATIAARYARGELLNTDRFVATMAPLATDPAVQSALTERVTDEVINYLDLPALINQATSAVNIRGLNALGGLVAGPITDWVHSFVYKHVNQFVSSATFASLWASILRAAHQAVDHILTGEKNGAVTATDGAIVLNIGPLVAGAKTALVNDGFSLASKVPTVNTSFTLFESDKITKVQGYVRLLNRTANWLPWITLAVFALALWAAPRRRRAAIAGVVFAGLLMIVELITNGYIRNAYVRALGIKGLDQPAGLVVYNQVTHYLILATVTALVTFIVAAVWLWLVGRGRVGTLLRRIVDPGFSWTARQIGWSRNGFWTGLYAYRGWVFLVLGVLAFVILLHNPFISTAIWLTIGALVITCAFAVIHRFGRRVTHPATPAAP